KPDAKTFTFDQILDSSSTQEAVFQNIGMQVIESCVAGYNGTIFAYGQTGSGKTFSMLGPSEEAGNNFNHPLRGVIPRGFDFLFGLIQKENELHDGKIEYLCKASFIEIYNEQIFDLLDPASRGLQLREDIKRGVFVDHQIERVISSSAEAYEVLSDGWVNRTVAATSMNRESSRSHAVFSIYIESKMTKDGVVNMRSSQLNLVDLAGSERQKDANTTGIRLKASGNINKSLSVLGNVIMALGSQSAGKMKFVPYRESKLTFLLRDSLGGNAKTTIVACVNPSSKCYGETLSTLNFARRAKLIKNKVWISQVNFCFIDNFVFTSIRLLSMRTPKVILLISKMRLNASKMRL
uniref:Kinesin-like protein n=1 Tax=Capitella teleta TaxID=283909 RepID=X1YYT2_CAPTE